MTYKTSSLGPVALISTVTVYYSTEKLSGLTTSSSGTQEKSYCLISSCRRLTHLRVPSVAYERLDSSARAASSKPFPLTMKLNLDKTDSPTTKDHVLEHHSPVDLPHTNNARTVVLKPGKIGFRVA